MEVRILKGGIVEIENHRDTLGLFGDDEVRDLIKKLTNALFEIMEKEREEVENGIKTASDLELPLRGEPEVR